jgi:PhzF family phenazine biosynthesis protein
VKFVFYLCCGEMEVEVVQVDAFAAEPFRGNPAAVCFLPPSSGEHQRGWPSDQWLQHLAAEMNLSETAFLLPSSAATHSFI